MSALSDAIFNVIVEEPTPQSYSEAEALAAKIAAGVAPAVEAAAPFVDLVTDLATRGALIDAETSHCMRCHAYPDKKAWRMVEGGLDVRELDHWHAPTCEWRRAREVCGHPEFRD